MDNDTKTRADYSLFGARAAGALDSYLAGMDDYPDIALDVFVQSLRQSAADCGITLAGVTA